MKKSLGAKTLIYPAPVWCVGTTDAQGKPNVATIAWGGICCSSPPSVTISLRKATYTYGNIMARGAYTLSVPPEKYAKEADFFGIASGRTVDKFKQTGLTPVPSEVVDAAYVKEFPMILECKVTHTHEVGLHTMFIAEVLDVKVDDSVLGDDGLPDMSKVKPFLYTPESRHYYGIGEHLGKAFGIGKVYGG